MKLYYHPFSSYCHKALIAFYENDTPFEPQRLDGSEPAAGEFARLWPVGKFPILADGERLVVEATMIVQYLDVHYPGPTRFLPDDADAAIETRMWDRFFDNYVMTPVQAIVGDALRPADARDPHGVARARAALDTAYAVADARMAAREWAAGDFGLADCAAAPSLLYADWAHPIPREHGHLWAYRDRLLARPSYARVLDEARPYRHLFPLGASNDRD